MNILCQTCVRFPGRPIYYIIRKHYIHALYHPETKCVCVSVLYMCKYLMWLQNDIRMIRRSVIYATQQWNAACRLAIVDKRMHWLYIQGVLSLLQQNRRTSTNYIQPRITNHWHVPREVDSMNDVTDNLRNSLLFNNISLRVFTFLYL